jgi:protein-disulfide isomerase
MNKGTAIVGFLLSFLAGAGLMYGVDHRAGGPGITAEGGGFGAEDQDAPIPIGANDAVWGNRNAPVTIVEFSDFQCPFCSRVTGTIDQVKQNYGKDKVRIVWKHEPLPFHKDARPAAIAAQAVLAAKGSEAFWKFHDLAFKNQQALNEDNFAKWAQEAGVDAGTFQKFKADPAVAKKVDEDNDVAKKVGANGTPHFYINGVELSGAQPYPKFQEVIDQQLEKAKQKIASGVKPEKVYATLAKENHQAKPAAAEKKDPPKRDEDTNTVWKVPVGKAPILGNEKAPVTVVVFSDYQCPFCKRAEDTIKKVRETYGDKVRLVWKDQPLPFHPRAKPAATLALEARAEKGDKGFWEAHDKLFASAPKLDDADLETIAKDLGLDAAKVKDAIAKDKYKAQIEADQGLADDLNASGTPHFFINGRRLVGAQPFEKFQAVIDEEVKKVDGLRAKGVAADKVYDEIMKEGKEPPPPEKKQIAAAGKDQPFRGGDKAKVVIQEFSDFECPFCSRVEPTVNEVMKTYGDKVKLVWRHKPLPMHKNAPLASEAAVEIYKQKGNDAFWKYHDKLFENQKTPDGLLRPALEKYAEELGADMGKFKKALDDHAHKALVDADSKVADDAGISGTPAFVINGYFISGAQPFAKFKKAIDRALAEAKLVDSKGGDAARGGPLRRGGQGGGHGQRGGGGRRRRGGRGALVAQRVAHQREERFGLGVVLRRVVGRDAGLHEHHRGRGAGRGRQLHGDDVVDAPVVAREARPRRRQRADLGGRGGGDAGRGGGARAGHELQIFQARDARRALEPADAHAPEPVGAVVFVGAAGDAARPAGGGVEAQRVTLEGARLGLRRRRPRAGHRKEHEKRGEQPRQGAHAEGGQGA